MYQRSMHSLHAVQRIVAKDESHISIFNSFCSGFVCTRMFVYNFICHIFFFMLACRSVSFFVLDSFYMNMNICFGSLLCALCAQPYYKYFHVCWTPIEKMELKAKILFLVNQIVVHKFKMK